MPPSNLDTLDVHEILEQLVITNPETVPVLFHAERQRILRCLIQEEKTIQELSGELHLNPGTIKRHLSALTACDLVRPSKILVNQYGIKMKYYRAVAKEYVISLRWPDKEECSS